ncbi:hypothetical protein Gotur_008315, partial [Gossypium turneri]
KVLVLRPHPISVDSPDVDLKFEDGDILRSTLNKILAIDFSERFKRILVKDMVTTVVFKLLGSMDSVWTLSYSTTLDGGFHVGTAGTPRGAANDDGKGEASNSVDIEPTLAMTGEAFDPWMVVECKSRCNQADNKIQNVKNTEEILAGSRLTTMNLLGKDSMRLKEKEADFMGTRSEQVEAQIKIIEAGGHALGDSLVEVY